jgi:penicillin-binding protein 2
MRKILLPAMIVIGSILLILKLFYLQVINESYKLDSENNALKIKYEYPERGYIYDRNGKLLVANQPSYDVMVVPREIKNLDTLAFCNALNISKDYLEKSLHKAKNHPNSPRIPSVFLPQLNKKEYAAFQEKIRKFQGFYIQKRALRDYQTKSAANVFGFITQVNPKIIESNPYYKSGDLIGRQGVEEYYEKFLRGKKGVKYVQRDKFNREIGAYKDGIYDTLAVQGSDITLTLDIVLQEYGEALMVNKRGGIVAIEPKTGEILALVTAPSYDPALLIGRDRSMNYTKLNNDSIAKPLYDRGLLAEYPPGSPFKILTGLIGLQEGVIDTKSGFTCKKGFSYGNRFMKCHDVGHFSLNEAVYRSCNTFFANTYKRIIEKYAKASDGVDAWSKHLKSFGLGNFMGYDLPTGRRGLVPSSQLYNRYYPVGSWRSTTIISNAIGQGDVLTTPIQLCNVMAAVANQGYYYTPHVIKEIKGHKIDKKFVTKNQTTIAKEHFPPIINGLFDVYNYGTASSLKVNDINICGKTGTAENFTKINGKRVQLTDHSIFVAFAPMEDPKIAIAVFVENGYFGARIAGPIASLMIEKYLKGEITRKDLEKRMFEKSLESEYAKVLSGVPFTINN